MRPRSAPADIRQGLNFLTELHTRPIELLNVGLEASMVLHFRIDPELNFAELAELSEQVKLRSRKELKGKHDDT